MGKRKKRKKKNGSDHLKQSSSGRVRATSYNQSDKDDAQSDVYTELDLAYMMAYGYGGWWGMADNSDIRPVADSIFGSGYYCVGDSKRID